jgi:DNA repair protein RecN (Recombination protein N)
MLTELRIENFAIIQRLALEFKAGLITFTGETGAGKSIILDAITAVVGGKADAGMIRSGSERASVEATFRLPVSTHKAVKEILEREDLVEEEAPDYVTLSRELRREGRSVSRINGRAASTHLVREIGAYLIDIHGQSEHLSLLNVRQHIHLLDRYASVEAALANYRRVYDHLMGIRRELNQLRQTEQDAERRTDLLSYQLQEIDAAGLKSGEEIDLKQERERLANAENLTSLAQQTLALLEEGTPEAPSISDMMGQVIQNIESLARIDTAKANLSEQAETVAELLSEITLELNTYLENVEYNPHRLEQAEERLDLIHKLQRKYGGSIESVLAFAENARQELETIAHATERIAELEAEESQALVEMARLGEILSTQRQEAAQRMQSAVENELNDLSMSGAKFAVDFQTQPDPRAGVLLSTGEQVDFDSNGIDHVEFLIAPNPGEGLKPLVKIASGGETSRLMLALKNVLAQADDIPTLIFDEIDQGIGGRVGMIVGEKLWQLARRHEVLCVTHLPQLAAFGDQHFHVRKLVNEGRTITQVEQLTESNRLEELVLMLGSLTDANRQAAHETLEIARKRAAELVRLAV